MTKNNLIPKENIVAVVEEEILEELERMEDLSLEVPFVSQTALMISKSQSIMEKISDDYPTIATLLDYNRSGTIGFLKANGALSGYKIVHSFKVPYSGKDDAIKVWSDYRDEIEKYVAKLCQELKNDEGEIFYEELRGARKRLADEIHSKYYQKLPKWPSVGEENTERFELQTGDSYQSGAYHIVWSCLGWITVVDKRPNKNTYEAEFSGNPDIKLLVFDCDELKRFESIFKEGGLDECKKMIDKTQLERDRSLLTWEDLK